MHPHIDELTFHKSSYSANGANCVEVARFRKSSYSGGRTDNCVEVSDLPSGAAVRDTQNRNFGALSFPSSEWSALLSTTRTG